MAKLFELLTEQEYGSIKKYPLILGVSLDMPVKKMTVSQLSSISLDLIKTEYGDKCPDCILSAKALEILFERAKKKDLGIF